MSQALVLFSPQYLGGREARKSTEGDNVVALLVLVHLTSLSSSLLHRLLKSTEALQCADLFLVPEQRDL